MVFFPNAFQQENDLLKISHYTNGYINIGGDSGGSSSLKRGNVSDKYFYDVMVFFD